MTFDEVIKAAELYDITVEANHYTLGFNQHHGILIFLSHSHEVALKPTIESVLKWGISEEKDLDALLHKLVTLKGELEEKVENKHNKLVEWKLKLNGET